MVDSKKVIAAIIVCLKPHVFLTLCIILVIVHSTLVALQRGISIGWRADMQQDVTLTMTILILFVAVMWATFFIFMVRFELRGEMESLLALFQCSKRGLRCLGVLAGHLILLTTVALLVSAIVENAMPISSFKGDKLLLNDGYTYYKINDVKKMQSLLKERSEDVVQRRIDYLHIQPVSTSRSSNNKILFETNTTIDRAYLLMVYKVWLTAIIYSFIYLILENMSMFYADMSLVEFIHEGFLCAVTKLTGIDLSDYPAGEMLFNPLVRRRFGIS